MNQPGPKPLFQAAAGGLHPQAQRYLWSLRYGQYVGPNGQSLSFEQKTPESLVRKGYIVLIDEGTYPDYAKTYEVTGAGKAALDQYARFLERDGFKCPPDGWWE